MCRATIASVVLQEKLSTLEKILGVGMSASEGPASSEAAALMLTIFTLLRDMLPWAVKGQLQQYPDPKDSWLIACHWKGPGCTSDIMLLQFMSAFLGELRTMFPI